MKRQQNLPPPGTSPGRAKNAPAPRQGGKVKDRSHEDARSEDSPKRARRDPP